MKLSTLVALIGSNIGGLTIVLIFYFYGISVFFFIAVGVTQLLCYILAACTVSIAPKFSEFIRGFMIGVNASSSGLILYTLFSLFAPQTVAIIIAAILVAINFFCVISWLSQGAFYQGIVGWSNWLLPMSWPVIGIGILFCIINLLLALVTLFQVDFLNIKGFKVDWATGTFFMKGGLISNLNVWNTAFNMGNFTFVDMKSSRWYINHEAGHCLNLAAFGSLFHFVGFIDEFVIQRGHNAYAERLAESHDTGTSSNNIPMWA